MTQYFSAAKIEDVAQQLGIRQEDLVQQGIVYYLEAKLSELNAELLLLKNKYNVQTIEEFDQLYESGVIEESDTWRDYQRFDNIAYKISQLNQLLSEVK